MCEFDSVENRILELSGQKVIIDSEVALLYGVETREINQAVRNNPDKFPHGYIFSLSEEEKAEVVRIFDNPNVKFSPKPPRAFTEGNYIRSYIKPCFRVTSFLYCIQ